MACYVFEKEVINLNTGQTEWIPISDAPASACPSCCDEKGKLLSRRKVTRDDCTMPFVSADTRAYRQQIEMIYADGDCGTYKEYSYALPCSEEVKQLKIAREVLPGLCTAQVEFTDLSGNSSIFDVTALSQVHYLPIGNYKVRVLRSGCLDALDLVAMVNDTQTGGTVWAWNTPPANIVINDLTFGFKVVYADYAGA